MLKGLQRSISKVQQMRNIPRCSDIYFQKSPKINNDQDRLIFPPSSIPTRYKFTVIEQPKLHVGQTIVVNKSFPTNDVRQFAALTHDTNPVHLNEEYAGKTRFGKCVVHGVFVLGFVSGVLGTQMPGIGTILISHEVKYPNPTFVGDTVSCKVEVVEMMKGRRVIVHVTCKSLEENHTVLDGYFKLMVTREAMEMERALR